MALLFPSGAHILRSCWIHDWGTDRPDCAGASDRKVHVAAQPGVGQHHSAGNKGELIHFNVFGVQV